ncbi:hypothetical protein BDP27DRAFT_1485807, partial [Rhodocollybia butyracea]
PQPSKQLKTNELRSYMPTGWHFGVWIATFEADVVLVINLSILLYCAIKTGGSIGVVRIFEGDCNTVDHATLVIHLVINVLSTLLLSASNYVTQSLSAPTRAEVDRAHEKGLWLDIGLQSIHNLKHTSGWKRLLWTLLTVSSIPLHLFYNSAFFSTIGVNDYKYYLARGPEMQGPDIEPANWEFLNSSDCLHAYTVDFLSNRRDLVVVLGNYTSNNTFSNLLNSSSVQDYIQHLTYDPFFDGFPPYSWICQLYYDSQSDLDLSLDTGLCSIDWREINPSNWTMPYCLSETTTASCQLEFNLPLLSIVVAFNIVKVACMVIVATRMRDNPLITLGDAIASFTNNPEPLTRDMCLMSQTYCLDGLDKNKDKTCYQPKKTQWMTVASRRHWIIIIFLFLAALSIILGLLNYAINELSIQYSLSGFPSLWQLGIGRVSSENIITGWKIPTQGYGAIVASVLIANLPQLIFSMIYLVFNSLCTKLFLALEWSSYAHSCKPLRVSDPRGDQRSTYFLNIPFRFGIPLMVYSALPHWLLSQSIFIVAVTFWDDNRIDTLNSITSCGYSPAAMILTAIGGVLLLLSSLAVGFKHLKCDMPLAGSCSKAISAAFHPPEDGSDPLRPMKWGVVPKLPDSSNTVIGHISFSSGEVSAPVPGRYYL